MIPLQQASDTSILSSIKENQILYPRGLSTKASKPNLFSLNKQWSEVCDCFQYNIQILHDVTKCSRIGCEIICHKLKLILRKKSLSQIFLHKKSFNNIPKKIILDNLKNSNIIKPASNH